MRLFAAILFSDEVRQTLVLAIDLLKQQVRHGSFTCPENLHVTLAFIGETTRITEAKEALRTAVNLHPGSFPLRLRASGRFNDTIWAGIADSPELSVLAQDIQDELRKKGFFVERRAFRPHITLERRVNCKQIQLPIPAREINVTFVSLVKSEYIDHHLRYTEIYRVNL